MSNSIAGVDYSMRNPCACIHTSDKDNDEFKIDNCKFIFVTPTAKYVGSFGHNKIIGYHFEPKYEATSEIERYDMLSDFFIGALADAEVKEVAIEDYAFAAKGQVFNIGENTGLLKYKLWSCDFIVHTYAPTQIKKYATGSGKAKKEDMYAAFLEETNLNLAHVLKYDKKGIDSPLADIVDSYYIAKYHYYLGHTP